jgi:hypothetical protein
VTIERPSGVSPGASFLFDTLPPTNSLRSTAQTNAIPARCEREIGNDQIQNAEERVGGSETRNITAEFSVDCQVINRREKISRGDGGMD